MIFWTIFIPISAFALICYFWYLDVLFKGKKAVFLIEESASDPSRPEFKNTFLNLFVFGLVGFLLGYGIDHGYTQIQTEFPKTFIDYLFLLISFFLALAIHDFYFYWSHRLLHSSLLFKSVHLKHHKSLKPNAWSAFSFHPVEGVIQVGIIPIVALILPIHESVLITFSFFLLFISVYGHCGYELRPNKLTVFRVFNTSLHHFQHHKFIHFNYGIYLNLWDRWFRTDYPKYNDDFEELKQRINAKITETFSNHDE